MTDTVMEALEEWFFNNDEFADKLEAFADNNCDIFEIGEGLEQKLEYTAIYNKFQELFQSLIEAFLKEKGVTVEQFAKLCEDETKKKEGNTFWHWLVATTDYSVFLTVMQDAKKKKLGQ
eukprot:TRINITY_DN67065_c12_g1_i1.p2 TRINITY_DN67065_c12_g1~~TRINITY_DN67065_c12_g1_i1.p2  ORF type:complete len:119 (-),score=34.81 TRINITY_DN67065_c12_g1_i1:127-483(-)